VPGRRRSIRTPPGTAVPRRPPGPSTPPSARLRHPLMWFPWCGDRSVKSRYEAVCCGQGERARGVPQTPPGLDVHASAGARGRLQRWLRVRAVSSLRQEHHVVLTHETRERPREGSAAQGERKAGVGVVACEQSSPGWHTATLCAQQSLCGMTAILPATLIGKKRL
jgi:hypothetical protein